MYRVEITFVDQSTGVKKLLHVGGDCRGHATLMVDGRVVGSFISDKQSSAVSTILLLFVLSSHPLSAVETYTSGCHCRYLARICGCCQIQSATCTPLP
jgi:hypothetical protein